ncbi:MAG: mercuric reductase [Elusimicrobia bacterium RIFCSPHIGHO2_02_FULL_57_9]|nr:MAG: mercuric reductase [Elusimicrobia bacterium RIFCSPHIGHO2_02_FULL_57_9]
MDKTVVIEPFDEHNCAVVSNGHPPDWVNPAPAGRYNLVVIGAGTAGLVTAAGAAGLGAKVALVEKHLMGGDCLNVGCVPAKALIRASRAFADVRDAGEYGVIVPDGARVDFSKVMERMRRLRAQISPNDSVHRFKKLGVDVFLGEARFTGSDTIAVDGRTLRFSKAIIASGARAAELPIPGLKEAGYLTNETIFSLTELPKRLAVFGAGPIGCELAQAFRRFGSQVHLIEALGQILIREDRDAAVVIEKTFAREGIEFSCNHNVIRVEKRGAEKVVFTECDCHKGGLVVDAILVGVGRAPNVEGLNLDAAGVEYDKKAGVKVDDRLRTANPRIYAAGDICSPYKFTHTAEAAARIVIQNAMFMGRKKASTLTIPWCTYTDPEIAHVGLYEKDAKEKGIAVDTFVQEFKDLDRAILDGESRGLIKVHVEKGTDNILGATIVARHAGEMISELTLAMTAKVGLGKIAGTIHPYPTQAECVKRVADAYNRTRLTPLVKSMLGRWLRWSR